MLSKKEQRLRRARQTRIRIANQGVARLTVNRTNLHIYATVISDDGTKVIATASTAEAELRTSLGGSGKGGNAAAATAVGVVGGAVAGNAIEGRNNRQDYVQGYRLSIQLDQGGYRVYDVSTPGDLRVGDRVRLYNGQISRM